MDIHIREYLEGPLWIPDALNNQGFDTLPRAN
jgi:hypothetical protein